MKTKLLTLWVALLAIAMNAQAQTAAQNTLTLTLADGTQHVLQLSERPELLWEGDDIIISAGNTELSIPRTDFRGFSVSDEDAIKTVNNGGSKVAVDANGQLQAEGLKAGTLIRVYDSSGRLVSQQTVASNGRSTLRIAGKSSGTFIVKIDNQPSIKIVKP